MTGRRAITRNAARLWRLTQVDGRPDPARVRTIAGRLLTSQRAARIRIVRAFLRMLRRDEAAHTAVVESAVPLDTGMRAEIQRDLDRRFGRGVAAAFNVNPSVIAGIRIRTASLVYDDTVLARLAALEMSA